MQYIKGTIIALISIGFLSSLIFADELQVGDMAPDFTLPYASADTINFDGITLSDLHGEQPVVLAFYPADWSSGCTTQLCNFRDNFQMFNQLNAAVLGISGDYVFSHKAWIEEEGFQFKLLSDHSHKVAKMYNSYRPKVGMNKRAVFVLNEEGKITYMNKNYKAGSREDFQALNEHLTSLAK